MKCAFVFNNGKKYEKGRRGVKVFWFRFTQENKEKRKTQGRKREKDNMKKENKS